MKFDRGFRDLRVGGTFSGGFSGILVIHRGIPRLVFSASSRGGRVLNKAGNRHPRRRVDNLCEQEIGEGGAIRQEWSIRFLDYGPTQEYSCVCDT